MRVSKEKENVYLVILNIKEKHAFQTAHHTIINQCELFIIIKINGSF